MKYIKKICCLLAAITLLTASLMPIKASAASPVLLSVSSASGKKGDRVTVNLNISGNSGAYGVQAGVRFDTSKLKFISASVGSAGGTMKITEVLLTDASVVLFSGMNSGAPLTASGTLMQITFEILMTSGSASLSVTGVDLVGGAPSYNAIACSTSGGTVTFKAPPPPTKPPTQPPTKPPTKPTSPPTKPTEAPTKPTGATETASGSTSETATENSSETGSLPAEENTYFSTEPNTDNAESTENASGANGKNPIKQLSEWISSVPARVSKMPMAFRVSSAAFGTDAVLFGALALYFFLRKK